MAHPHGQAEESGHRDRMRPSRTDSKTSENNNKNQQRAILSPSSSFSCLLEVSFLFVVQTLKTISRAQ
eukprot:scaffold4743_cov171-Amphora_coffeaeformis.AAC.27